MFSLIKNDIKLLRNMDWLAVFFQAALLAVGVLFIYGTGSRLGGAFSTKWLKQIMWIASGLGLYMACTLIDYRRLGSCSWLFYFLGLILLTCVDIMGTNINGAQSWLNIGGISIQPSEFIKPATLLFMSWAVTHPAWRNSLVPPFAIVSIVVLPPLVLVLKQPDLGTTLVFIPFTLSIAFIKGLRWRWIIISSVLCAFFLPVLFSQLREHQQSRIKVFLDTPTSAAIATAAPFVSAEQAAKWNEAHTAFFKGKKIDTWNADQSLLSVGSGGITGKGFRQGTQYLLGYLPRPVAPTDFIFSVIAEETGFIGATLVTFMLVCVILCACRTAIMAADELGMCLALGSAAILATHTFVNIGMTIQAAPIIGIPLPFVSYGGSFMISTMVLAGLCQSVHIRRFELQDYYL